MKSINGCKIRGTHKISIVKIAEVKAWVVFQCGSLPQHV
jgi:hypothetical protein